MDKSRLECIKRVMVFFCGIFLSLMTPGAAKKVLMLAPPVGSHLLQANAIAEGLIDREHDVYVTLDTRLKLNVDFLHPKLKVIRYDNGVDVIFDTPEYQIPLINMELLDMGTLGKISTGGKLLEDLKGECQRTFENKDLLARLHQEKFDFLVIDGMFQCYCLVPHILGVPFATFSSFIPIGIPHAGLQGPFLVNGPFDSLFPGTYPVLTTLVKVMFVIAMQATSDVFGNYTNKTVFDLHKESKLWLYDKSLVLDNAMPVSPNVIHVGGLNARPSKSLPVGELKRFTDSAVNGFILVSFGSFAKHFPDHIVNSLLEAFAELPYQIVWKWDKSSLKPSQVVPTNVLVLNWIQQNDVLGHSNIRLFVTHCGGGGTHEALYHGVPMLAIPLFGDQLLNAKVIKKQKFGLTIRINYLSKENIVSGAKTIINDRSFSENIGKASKIFRDQPMGPKQTAAYWIDHVMKYGAEHLQSETNEMAWYKILLFDVLLLVISIFLFSLVLCFVICRLSCLFCKWCCGRRQTAENVKVAKKLQ